MLVQIALGGLDIDVVEPERPEGAEALYPPAYLRDFFRVLEPGLDDFGFARIGDPFTPVDDPRPREVVPHCLQRDVEI